MSFCPSATFCWQPKVSTQAVGWAWAALKQAPDLLLKVLLAVQVRLGDQYVFAFQISSSKFRYFN